MFWLKACPRCRGDLYRQSRDADASFNCLQCGHELRRDDALALLARARRRPVPLSA
jgi:hypothetical protein